MDAGTVIPINILAVLGVVAFITVVWTYRRFAARRKLILTNFQLHPDAIERDFRAMFVGGVFQLVAYILSAAGLYFQHDLMLLAGYGMGIGFFLILIAVGVRWYGRSKRWNI